MKINVAVTSAGSAPAVAVIKALKSQNEIYFHITGMDMDAASSGNYLADRGVVIPGPDSPVFIDRVLSVCRRHNLQCLIPIIDEELFVFAQNRHLFARAGIKVLLNRADTIRLAKNKFFSYEFCIKNKIPVPKIFLQEDISKICGSDYPLIIKPIDGRGSRGVLLIKDKEGLDFYNKQCKNFIIQKFIEGDEYTIDIVASPAGRILQAVPRQRVSVKAGMSYKGRIVNNAKLINFGKITAKKFKITGPANIQCIVKKGDIYLIEVNPKFAAGLPLTVASGVNIPLILVKLAYGLKVKNDELKIKERMFMLRYWEEIFVRQQELEK